MSTRLLTTSAPRLAYTVTEPRHGQAPRRTYLLSHALGCDVTMWDALVAHLSADSRVVCYDQRGHGQSETPAGPYTMAQLADDAARLIDELQLGPITWIGLSMGGMIGQELALRHPAKVQALVLANTTAYYPDEARTGWDQRIATIAQDGLAAIVDGAMLRWFHDGFRAEQPDTVAYWKARVLACDPAGYMACCQAIRDVDTTARLGRIGVPTLVIAGELDLGTPPAMARAIAHHIPGAQLVILSQASHLSVLEQPGAFIASVDHWLRTH
ncbi:MAG TPA: 3-oxoadipate enol-lactonase [Aquabacterium sp.]|nr:3-oxoadipate enol-lactonase [Aquabacterium sp.]